MTTLKEKSPESIVLRFVWLENLTQDYTNEEIGQIVRDLYGYARNGTIPPQYLDRGMRGLWRSMKDGVDKDFSKYSEKSQKNSEAAKARWVKQAQKDDLPVVQTDTNALCEMRTHPNRENVLAWVRIVQEQAALSRFQSLALQSANAAFDELPELYSQMGETLTIGKNSPDFQSIGELTEAYIREKDSEPQYIPTGVSVLDKFLHLSPGNLFIIGGRPSAGKTALSLQMACEQARRGFRVCYFSLETDPGTLTNRIIANRLAVPLAEVKAKTVPQHELDRLAELHKLPLFIRSASGKGVGWVKAQAQRMQAQVVFIDYLQLLATSGAKDRYQQITAISIALHELAQTTGILVVALAQLNRNAAHAAPSTADLKESGQLEQDADAILLLSDDGEQYRASLDKNKEGRVGILPIAFDKECQRFLEVEERR